MKTFRTTVSTLLKPVRRFWSAVSQPGTGGLVQPGDWRCRYEDGQASRWLSHGDAYNMQLLHGGTLEWRYDNN